ncbi:hypothetical protein, partial [Escherichia coli]|uniref:hypothetical protein n=1 Tax=Escherichia coli TaxID=562 RepID=UPI0019346AB1
QGFTISNLTLDNSGQDIDCGVFGAINGSITNVKFNNITLTGDRTVGILALVDSATITNVTATNVQITKTAGDFGAAGALIG